MSFVRLSFAREASLVFFVFAFACSNLIEIYVLAIWVDGTSPTNKSSFAFSPETKPSRISTSVLTIVCALADMVAKKQVPYTFRVAVSTRSCIGPELELIVGTQAYESMSV